METILDEDQGTPKSDDPLISPPCKRKADANDLPRDKVLAAVLSQTEIMVLRFTQSGGLSQRRGQALLDMLRHPNFDIKDVQSTNIVHLLRRLERPFKESTVTTYNLWKPGDGNQRLELVVRDFLEVFREIT